jgi:hypothetical protein
MARKLMQYISAKEAAEESLKVNVLEAFDPVLKYGAQQISMHGGYSKDGYLWNVGGSFERHGDYNFDNIIVTGNFVDAMLELPTLTQRQAYVKVEVDRRKAAADEQAKKNAEQQRLLRIKYIELELKKLRGE